mmetsp:Transcript_10989/g.10655  ORF Transcript_10989/g.10655 Transcript_10989/m.10655 type:complete len:246 (+) Transcript_10989:144-881(+)
MDHNPFIPTPSVMAATTSNEKAAATGADTEGLKAWQILTKSGPVAQATFLAWYATTHKKKTPTKRGVSSSILSKSKPAAKKQRQGVLPVGTAADALSQQPTTLLTKGKRTALVKAITSSLKASIKAKKTKWHAGDHDVKVGTAVMDATDFVALFPGVSMTQKGVTTSFSLTKEVLIDTFGDFKLSIPTWSMPRNFRKAYKTGSNSVSLHGADGKYSTGTSTLTLKFSLSIGGGWVGDLSMLASFY